MACGCQGKDHTCGIYETWCVYSVDFPAMTDVVILDLDPDRLGNSTTIGDQGRIYGKAIAITGWAVVDEDGDPDDPFAFQYSLDNRVLCSFRLTSASGVFACYIPWSTRSRLFVQQFNPKDAFVSVRVLVDPNPKR